MGRCPGAENQKIRGTPDHDQLPCSFGGALVASLIASERYGQSPRAPMRDVPPYRLT